MAKKGNEIYRKKKKGQPPATILTISSLSPGASWRLENSEGATASPLCSTTTLRGKRFCARRNSSSEQGKFLESSWPLAMTNLSFTKTGCRTRYARESNPFDCVFRSNAYCAIFFIDANRPDFAATLKLFKTQRGVVRVLAKYSPCLAGADFGQWRNLSVRAPERRPDFGNHNLSGSSGAKGSSRKASATKASNFGRVR